MAKIRQLALPSIEVVTVVKVVVGAVVGSVISFLVLLPSINPQLFDALFDFVQPLQGLLGGLATLCAASIAYAAVMKRMNFDKRMKEIENQRIAHALVVSLLHQTTDLLGEYKRKVDKIANLDKEGCYRKAYDMLMESIQILQVPSLYNSGWRELSLISHRTLIKMHLFEAHVKQCKTLLPVYLGHPVEKRDHEGYLHASVANMLEAFVLVATSLAEALRLIGQEQSRLAGQLEDYENE